MPLGAALGVAAGALVPTLPFGGNKSRRPSYSKREAQAAAAQLGRAIQWREYESYVDPTPEAEAWQRIDTLLSSGDEDGKMLRAMLVELPRHVSDGSVAQRELADVAWDAGLPPHPRVCNALLAQLLREARGADSVSALQAEMGRRGVAADAETRRVVSRSADELALERGQELRRLLRWGREQVASGLPALSTTAAWRMWERLLAHGEARSNHLGVMLAHGCADSEAQAALMEAAVNEHGVVPNAAPYATRVYRLMLEGHPKSAVEALVSEMGSRHGLRPEEHGGLQRALNRSRRELSALRTHKLTKMLATTGAYRLHDARTFYEGLLGRGACDSYQLAAYLAHGTQSSAECAAAIRHAESLGVECTTHCVNVLLTQLLLEGVDDPDILWDEARLAMAPPRGGPQGLAADARTRELMRLARTRDDASRMRSAQLGRWLRAAASGEPSALSAAWDRFSLLCERGKLSAYEVMVMRPAAQEAERMLREGLREGLRGGESAGGGAARSGRLGPCALPPGIERHLQLYAEAEARFSTARGDEARPFNEHGMGFEW